MYFFFLFPLFVFLFKSIFILTKKIANHAKYAGFTDTFLIFTSFSSTINQNDILISLLVYRVLGIHTTTHPNNCKQPVRYVIITSLFFPVPASVVNYWTMSKISKERHTKKRDQIKRDVFGLSVHYGMHQ